MSKDMESSVERCEEMAVAIGDLALSGQRLQAVCESGVTSVRVTRICGALFTEIAELAGAADPASADSDT